jgi:hypothetical protein
VGTTALDVKRVAGLRHKHDPASLGVPQDSPVVRWTRIEAQTFSQWERGNMRRERVLKVVLVVVGLIFSALVYPMILFVKQEPALSMMMSLYVTLGIFLLLASRNPPAHRSLIAFTAWSSLVHAALMGFQAYRNFVQHGEFGGVAVLILIGIALIALAPREQPTV